MSANVQVEDLVPNKSRPLFLSHSHFPPHRTAAGIVHAELPSSCLGLGQPERRRGTAGNRALTTDTNLVKEIYGLPRAQRYCENTALKKTWSCPIQIPAWLQNYRCLLGSRGGPPLERIRMGGTLGQRAISTPCPLPARNFGPSSHVFSGSDSSYSLLWLVTLCGGAVS